MSWWMNPRVVRHNIKGLPKDPLAISFSEQIEVWRKIRDWKSHPDTQTTWVSLKRKSLTRALAEFKDLYRPTEFFADFGKNDDSVQIFYRAAEPKG